MEKLFFPYDEKNDIFRRTIRHEIIKHFLTPLEDLGFQFFKYKYHTEKDKSTCKVKNNIYFCTRVSPTRHAPSESPRA